ncbi:cadherin-1-like, partial [Oxyura jamaicensis]|uniref:cadherin-1-like n=1 Tax=Oxyura jamaicensis TaxID=8884 RepID=UPI0015A71BEC
MGRQRGSLAPLCFPLLLLLQVGGRRCDEAAPCQPGFAVETFAFTVPRESVAAGGVLGRVRFSGCGGRSQAVYVPDDTRFEVDEDGVIRTKQPLQLHGGEIRFSVSALDATGKRHWAWVTVEKSRSRQHHRRSYQDGVPYMLAFPESGPGLRRQKRDWVIPPISCLENHRGPFPMKLV